MEKYSAAYSYTNYNFVVQNIEGDLKTKDKYYPLICVLKNILQRGCPTRISQYLKDNIGDIDLEEKKLFGLVDNELPKWIKTIKGDDENRDYPAKVFFEKIIPKYLPNYKFIQQLILPEAEINEIVDKYNEEFIEQRVDFYLPQCKLVIEIDGYQHREEIQRKKDLKRTKFLEEYGIKTIRIGTKELKEENRCFKEKIEEIKSILKENENVLKIYNYKNIDDYDKEDLKHLKLNAILRLQIALLSLLEKGILKLDDDCWRINILNRDVYGYVEHAIEDLYIWFENLCILNDIEFNRPDYIIEETRNPDEYLCKNGYINIDFSMNKRYTDENELYKNIIFVRTDYIDKKRYFKISASDPIKYDIDKENPECTKSLEFFLKNIFGFDSFRDGQLPIIINSLQGEDTIGILPTGSGKSICYQLTALLQPCVSFVVCPIIALIEDQKDNLDGNYIKNIETITSNKNAKEKEEIMSNFAKGKYQFIFISPERFQSKRFRRSMDELNRHSTIAMAIIDEVHCLSEWGHDFRTSYLNLIKTIRKFAPSARLLGLTATASNFVLQDIKKEFEIDSYNIKTLSSFNREELEFEVIECDRENLPDRKELLFNILDELNKEQNILEKNGKDTNSGIIFTPHVNGKKGCPPLSNDINKKYGQVSNYFSGSVPKEGKGNDKHLIMSEEEYRKRKKKVQSLYKKNEIPLLVATKAFGMGVDKPNIRYTIHYGIPMSLESLYQEAGRAGRDRNKAKCYVLYKKEMIDDDRLEKFFSLDTSVEELKEEHEKIQIQYDRQEGDVLTNFFLWFTNNKGVDYEFEVVKKVFNECLNKNSRNKLIFCKRLGHSSSDIERAIYRLAVLGIVEDWTIEDWDEDSGVIELLINDFNEDSIYEHMDNYIKKYDKEFDISILRSNKKIKKNVKTFTEMRKAIKDKELNEYEGILKALLIWIYDNILYTRRQSMRTISELCDNFDDKETFKEAIEKNFKFDDDTFKLDEIAESPENYDNWFEICTNSKGEISISKIKETKFTLSRFLESYRYNTGLNFISGIVRLVTDDYNNIDGKQRLESAFDQISEYDMEAKSKILDFSLKVGDKLNKKNKEYLSEVLCKNYDDKLKIHEALNDDHSLTLIIDDLNKRIGKISRMIEN